MKYPNQDKRVRLILRAGSIVFGLSALILFGFPSLFNALLGFDTSPALEWAMRMIGITLVALSGNMYSVSSRGSEKSVQFSGRVMIVCAAVLGFLTLVIPNQLNWFTIGYAGVGFGFSIAYLWAFTKK